MASPRIGDRHAAALMQPAAAKHADTLTTPTHSQTFQPVCLQTKLPGIDTTVPNASRHWPYTTQLCLNQAGSRCATGHRAAFSWMVLFAPAFLHTRTGQGARTQLLAAPCVLHNTNQVVPISSVRTLTLQG
jgi:hypothetical protein